MRAVSSLLACVLLAACGSEQSGEFETEDGEVGSYVVDQDSGETTATIKTPEGTATMRSGQNVPLDLPGGFSLYPGAEVLSNTTFEQGDSSGSLVLLQSDASPEDLAKFYRSQAEDAGIDVSVEMSVNDGRMIGGEGEDGETFSFNANSNDGKTSAQLMVGQKLGQ